MLKWKKQKCKNILYKMESQEFRLKEITRVQNILESEESTRMHLVKKYRRARNITYFIEVIFNVSTIILGALSPLFPYPEILMNISAGCGALGIPGKYLNKHFSSKVEKHEKIKTLATTKLNTINSYISQALTDGKISDEKFQLISSELDKYYKMKDELKMLTRKNIEKNNIEFKELKTLN